MKILAFALLAFVGIAHAQVTCQTYGNTTNCNGSLGSQIQAQPFVNYGAEMAKQELMNQQAALAQQQAQLARAQAEFLRQQNEQMRQQIAAQQQAQAAQQQAQAAQQQAQEALRQQAQRQGVYQKLPDEEIARRDREGSRRELERRRREEYNACVKQFGVVQCFDTKKMLDEQGKK